MYTPTTKIDLACLKRLADGSLSLSDTLADTIMDQAIRLAYTEALTQYSVRGLTLNTMRTNAGVDAESSIGANWNAGSEPAGGWWSNASASLPSGGGSSDVVVADPNANRAVGTGDYTLAVKFAPYKLTAGSYMIVDGRSVSLNGVAVYLDIDAQGAQTIKVHYYPADATIISAAVVLVAGVVCELVVTRNTGLTSLTIDGTAVGQPVADTQSIASTSMCFGNQAADLSAVIPLCGCILEVVFADAAEEIEFPWTPGTSTKLHCLATGLESGTTWADGSSSANTLTGSGLAHTTLLGAGGTAFGSFDFGSALGAMTLVSTAITLDESPALFRILLDVDGVDVDLTPGEDIMADVSRDGGNTWAEADLELTVSRSGHEALLSGAESFSGPSGTVMLWRVRTTDERRVDVLRIAVLAG